MITLLKLLAALLQAFGGGGVSEGTHNATGAGSPIATSFSTGNYNTLKQQDPTQNLINKPKAYLNYALFDDRFNIVNENSGVKQVQGNPDELQILGTSKIVVKKTGFLYIYTSNESGEDVFFDNLIVAHNVGPLMEETHYYPFGLTMAGISSNALKGFNYPENRHKFNKGSELQNKEFDDGSGWEMYFAPLRSLDPQLGRWWQIDSKPDYAISPYVAMQNNPLLFSDPLGDTIVFDKSTTKEFQQAFATAATDLIAHGQGKELARLFFSKDVYVVKEFEGTNGMFSPNTDSKGNLAKGGTISWNPSNAKETETGAKISPATVLNHEFDHAAEYDRDPQSFVKGVTTPDAQYGNKEEKRVITGNEQRTAKGLGEIAPNQTTRRSHEFKNQILVNNPTSTKGTVISPYYNLETFSVTVPKKHK